LHCTPKFSKKNFGDILKKKKSTVCVSPTEESVVTRPNENNDNLLSRPIIRTQEGKWSDQSHYCCAKNKAQWYHRTKKMFRGHSYIACS